MTREEAIKEIIDMANALQLIPNTPKGKAVSMAIQALEQEPKTGHWIVWDTSSYDWTYKCDKCGRIVLKESNYCPKCGCRMVELQESEEV